MAQALIVFRLSSAAIQVGGQYGRKCRPHRGGRGQSVLALWTRGRPGRREKEAKKLVQLGRRSKTSFRRRGGGGKPAKDQIISESTDDPGGGRSRRCGRGIPDEFPRAVIRPGRGVSAVADEFSSRQNQFPSSRRRSWRITTTTTKLGGGLPYGVTFSHPHTRLNHACISSTHTACSLYPCIVTHPHIT